MDPAGAGDDERDVQRERYRELLEELRTVLPGVQVLFAFLLTAPFSSRFGELDRLGRTVYSAAVLGVALTTVVFLAPAAHHRLAPDVDRSDRVRTAVVLVVAGMATLGGSVAAVLFVVIRFVFDSTPLGAGFAAVAGAMVVVLWFALPLVRQRSAGGD